jgi:hypothetical protein
MSGSYSRLDPSPRFRMLGDLYKQAHEEGLKNREAAQVFPGNSLADHVELVRTLAQRTGAKTMLDYGCGKAQLYKARDIRLPGGTMIPGVREFWGVDEVRLYDPGVGEYAQRPDGQQFDGLVSTDVLEHIPEEDIPWVLAECFAFARRFVYMNIASYPAKRILPNGWNAHVTIRPPQWWREQIETAARGWQGQAYVFLVEEPAAGPFAWVARKLKTGGWKYTTLEWPEPPNPT